jgi:hypothetical protein
MVVLEDVVFSEVDVAERTSVMPIYRLIDTLATVNVPTPSYEAVFYFIEADIA